MIRTVSLETAKLLKEAGFPRTSFFVSHIGKIETRSWVKDNVWGLKDEDFISMPTSDELLEEMPSYTEVFKLRLLGYEVIYNKEIGSLVKMFSNESLPEALASMWLFLKKEGLL